jgi:hypothetical protein
VGQYIIKTSPFSKNKSIFFARNLFHEIIILTPDEQEADEEVPKKSKSSGGGGLMSMLIGPLLQMFFSGGGGSGMSSQGDVMGSAKSSKANDVDDSFGDLFGTMISMFLG